MHNNSNVTDNCNMLEHYFEHNENVESQECENNYFEVQKGFIYYSTHFCGNADNIQVVSNNICEDKQNPNIKEKFTENRQFKC